MKKQFFTVATFLAFKGIANEAFEAMEASKRAELLTEQAKANEEYFKELEASVENKISKEELETLKTAHAQTVKEINELAQKVALASENKTAKNTDLTSAMFEAFKKVEDSLTKVANGEADTIKTVVNITDATTIDAVGSASHYSLTTNTGIVSKIRSRILTYLQNVSIRNINGNRAMWIEELDEQGTPIFIAEAATKTKVSVRYEEREKKSKKIGIYAKVTTEFLRNLPQLVSYVQANLLKRLDIATEDQLFNGDDTGNNLKGIVPYATAFTGGSLAGTIAAPSAADVFRAVALQIVEAYGMPTALWVRPSVIASMDVEKSADGIYQLPPFRSANGNQIAGMTLIESNGLPDGYDFVGGDLSVVQVAFAAPLSIEINRSGDDMINNMRTILVEQELVQWVSANDTQVLVKGDIASAITALTA